MNSLALRKSSVVKNRRQTLRQRNCVDAMADSLILTRRRGLLLICVLAQSIKPEPMAFAGPV